MSLNNSVKSVLRHKIAVFDSIASGVRYILSEQKTVFKRMVGIHALLMLVIVLWGVSADAELAPLFLSIYIGLLGLIVQPAILHAILANSPVRFDIGFQVYFNFFKTIFVSFCVTILMILPIPFLLMLSSLFTSAVSSDALNLPVAIALLVLLVGLIFLLILPRLFFMFPLVVDGKSTPLRSVKRSWQISSGNTWRLCALFMLSIIIVAIIYYPLAFLIEVWALNMLIGLTGIPKVIFGAGFVFGGVIYLHIVLLAYATTLVVSTFAYKQLKET